MPNEDLHPLLSKIHQTLGDVLKSIQELKGEVTKVHTAITEGVTTLRDAIHENIQAQAELKMMERVVEVRSILPQIEAEKERIEAEEEDLDRRLERIAERYEKKHEELDEKAAKRIRDVGSHIFEIDEDEFEDGIEEPFVENVTTAWQTLQMQNETSVENRRERVESTTGDVVADIHDFVDQQRELVDRIQQVRTDFERSLSEPRTVQLPYYTVYVEKEGQTERHTIVPSRTTETNGHCTVSLEPFPGMDHLVSSTDLNHVQTSTLDGATVRGELTPHISDDKPLVSYGSAVEEVVSERAEVSIEGGR